jgi:hypothetical protein
MNPGVPSRDTIAIRRDSHSSQEAGRQQLARDGDGLLAVITLRGDGTEIRHLLGR